MKKYGIALFVLSLATFGFAGSGVEATNARLQAAASVLQEIMAAPDKGIPEEVLNDAKCIAVVPDMAKGGFIVGGEHGRGVVTCRTAHGGMAPESGRTMTPRLHSTETMFPSVKRCPAMCTRRRAATRFSLR